VGIDNADPHPELRVHRATDLAISNNKSVIHVLHVDDDQSIQEITKLMLLDLNSSYVIDWACCVNEGFKKLSTGYYDIVVSDYEMPQKNGLQFLEELRQQKNQIPFILFTGKGREEVAIQALNLGADGYHNKQGNPETVYGELSHLIKSTVEHYKVQRTLIESEDSFQRLFEQSPIVLEVYDKDGFQIQVNQAWDKLWKVPREFTLRKYNILQSNIKRAYAGEIVDVPNLEYDASLDPSTQGEGRKRWLQTTIYPLKEEGGQVTKIVVAHQDITEKKLAEMQLKSTFEVLEKVGEAVDAGLAVIDKSYHVVWANRRLMDLGVAPNKGQKRELLKSWRQNS
jgi:DNA-binding response OmpR family regulator